MATVYVGLSGGVDSAVAAALLKEGGHSVVGCFIKIWQPEFIECTWRDDRLDAMRVAASLRIPFREIDCSDEYKREVVDSMVADYARGLTPNPDVLCNRIIKFGRFLSWARENGAGYVATGHYARIVTQAQYFGFTKPEFSSARQRQCQRSVVFFVRNYAGAACARFISDRRVDEARGPLTCKEVRLAEC